MSSMGTASFTLPALESRPPAPTKATSLPVITPHHINVSTPITSAHGFTYGHATYTTSTPDLPSHFAAFPPRSASDSGIFDDSSSSYSDSHSTHSSALRSPSGSESDLPGHSYLGMPFYPTDPEHGHSALHALSDAFEALDPQRQVPMNWHDPPKTTNGGWSDSLGLALGKMHDDAFAPDQLATSLDMAEQDMDPTPVRSFVLF